MFKQIRKLVALLMVISMVLAACATPRRCPGHSHSGHPDSEWTTGRGHSHPRSHRKSLR